MESMKVLTVLLLLGSTSPWKDWRPKSVYCVMIGVEGGHGVGRLWSHWSWSGCASGKIAVLALDICLCRCMCSWWCSFDNCTISNCDIPPDAGQCDMLMVVCIKPFDRLLKQHVDGYRECRVLDSNVLFGKRGCVLLSEMLCSQWHRLEQECEVVRKPSVCVCPTCCVRSRWWNGFYWCELGG